jgi:hypothetical protein
MARKMENKLRQIALDTTKSFIINIIIVLIGHSGHFARMNIGDGEE